MHFGCTSFSPLRDMEASLRNYAEMLNQLQLLQAQLAEVTARERANVIADIQHKMEEYGIELSELTTARKRNVRAAATTTKHRKAATSGAANKASKTSKATSMREVRYRDPESGATWSGRGRMPRWLAGKDREQFSVTH